MKTTYLLNFSFHTHLNKNTSFKYLEMKTNINTILAHMLAAAGWRLKYELSQYSD